ncbi:hypothetical protein K438DRAFT_1978276 [Mycena galopus ATCC 62051]|nr:hypothetical protein K438DRAFT_1994559 [Mycena galopus ATCC 62051]KAF8177958.1 hypothetical protein K438DRAFT_1978276 [Mycena galopus ATCC 62051]
MHRGLEILEIAEMIAEQVGTHCHQSALGREKTSQRRDLSALARTSKTFLHPALNILWRDQDTIVPLLKCMPADLWDISVRPNEDVWPERVLSIDLNRTILSADWARPLFYLHRIKSFTVHHDCLFEHLEFFEALSLCLPVQHIFPNLEKLSWIPEPGTAFHHVRLFLAPKIKELELGSIRSISDHCIFSDLAARCPSLTALCVYSSLPVLSIPSMSAFVKASTQLESLAIPGLDDTAFIHAATLPNLKNLTLRGHVAPISPLPFAEGRVYFPSLTTLTTSTMDDAITIISTLGTCSLLCITMYGIRSRPTTTIARHSYSTLARHCSHSSLRELAAKTDVLFPRTLSADHYSLYAVGGISSDHCFPSLILSPYCSPIPSGLT